MFDIEGKILLRAYICRELGTHTLQGVPRPHAAPGPTSQTRLANNLYFSSVFVSLENIKF